VKQQIQNEQVMSILRKVEGEAGHVAKNIEGACLGGTASNAFPRVILAWKGQVRLAAPLVL